MLHIENKNQCSGCHACAEVCPQKCICMKEDEEGFLYPQVHEESCVDCGICEKICPVRNRKQVRRQEHRPVAFAAYSRDELVRQESSSGGVFTEIAKFVLGQGGVVFGAAFDEKFGVYHLRVTCVEELALLRGSKYVQSEVKTAYSQAKHYLEQGKWVLFSGTPCQIEGLYAYLGKEYERIITQDLICHGVPSRMVWERYIKYREGVAESRTRKMFFRYKKHGWRKYSVRFEFDNQTKYEQVLSKDLYMRVFLADICLRPSCYVCAFKSKKRRSDITLADFWGIQNVLPEMDDDKGTSLVILNSPKGSSVFEKIKGQLLYKETELDEVIKYNSAMVKSAECPKNRDKFMKEVHSEPFDSLIKKYVKRPSIVKRVLHKVKRLMKR